MKRIKKLIFKYFFDEIHPNIRVMNAMWLICLAAAVLALIVRIIIGFSLYMIFALAGLIIFLPIFLLMKDRFHDHPWVNWIVFVITGDILFSLAFFFLGGANGGMSAFFVVSQITIFLLFKGKPFVVLLSLHIIVITGVYYIGYRFPSLPIPITPYQQFLDNVQTILMGGLCIGFAVKAQKNIYTVQKSKTDDFSKELLKQGSLLRAVNDTAAILLTVDETRFDTALQISMEILAGSVDVDHVYIWKNHQEKGGIYYTQKASWERETGNNKAMSKLDAAYNSSLPLWEDRLLNGECINGPIRDFPSQEYTHLKPYGIKSILVTPVFLQERFWGFVSFDDCRHERKFSASEENILCSGSLLMVNAVVRNEMTASLIKAREEALSSARSKSNFLANMSHEMRTPMNAITGMTTIAKSSSDRDQKDYCLDKIADASTHLLGVINDILDMSKIEANKFELSPDNFNFEKMLQKVVSVVNIRVDEKRQNFHIYIDQNIPQFFNGDDLRLAQVITNLLSNAVKFTPEKGSIRLDTRLKEEKDSIYTIQFEVADTGIGISEEQKERLFNSFEQADSGTARKFGGTGLGLAISKRIVEMMGGRIWVESELGSGSTFIFTVKLKYGKNDRMGLLNNGVNWQNLRTLVVDADPEIHEYFKRIAKQQSFACGIAVNGEDALRMAKENGPYDIIFIGLNVPGINSIELSRKIKKQNSGNAVAIMTSVTEWQTVEEDARNAGVDKFLPKPLFPSVITDCINECIGIAPYNTKDTKTKFQDDFTGYRVLLAEDVEINREIVLTLFEPTGLKIDCAENGIRVLEMFKASPEIYDMILMDVQMPEMDGYEATRQIRAFEAALKESAEPLSEPPKAIPIIAMTANVFKEDIQKSLEAGMNDHIGKPLDIEEVLSKLRYYLPQKHRL